MLNSTIPAGNHHKALVTQDSKIESANKKIRATKASVDRAEERLIEAHRRAIVDPNSEKLRHTVERATKMRTNAETAYTKAVEASMDRLGTGSGRVMVLLPSQVADNSGPK